ncbi:hypothetical protein [Streptomyces sp. NBC_01361]|uniref:hypothetical protein n=1 Tax=Streptomyces sp. NBC_01361 TaxID=2903838 RepID=UPI002E3711D1|nr:hypothetical protein [Streptomyces sp. NBC_01361]
MNQSHLDDIGARISSAAAEFAPAHRPIASQTADAAALLRDMLQVAEQHDVTFTGFDAVADFPRMAIQLVMNRDAQR